MKKTVLSLVLAAAFVLTTMFASAALASAQSCNEQDPLVQWFVEAYQITGNPAFGSLLLSYAPERAYLIPGLPVSDGQ